MSGNLWWHLDRLYLALGRAAGRERRARAMLDLPAVQNPALVAPPAGRLLVLAPHPDDEAIGCGGTLLRLDQRDEHVEVVLMTAGDQGREDWEPARTVATRAREMEEAMRLLGLSRLHRLPGRDGALAEQPELAEPMRALIDRLRPDAVLLPAFTDPHLDHLHTNLIFLEAARGLLPGTTPVWGYEVWGPCPANVTVDISGVAQEKARAVAAHVSQNELLRFSEASLGLNLHRAMQVNYQLDPALTHAEAFLRLPLSEYQTLAAGWLARVRGR